MECNWPIYDQALRFHIRAASDQKGDQRFKLAVRDEVLFVLRPYVKEVKNAGDMEETVWRNIEEIKNAIQKTKEKFPAQKDESISIYSAKERFPVRTYGNVVFPAGNYKAIRIDIGSGNGHNWWCAFYPKLCFYEEDSEEERDDDITKIKFLFWEWVIGEK